MNNEAKHKLIDEIGPNRLIIIADVDGADGYFKIRGLTARQIGVLYGAALEAVHHNLNGMASQVERQDPKHGLKDLFDGVAEGKRIALGKVQLMVRDRRDLQEDKLEGP